MPQYPTDSCETVPVDQATQDALEKGHYKTYTGRVYPYQSRDIDQNGYPIHSYYDEALRLRAKELYYSEEKMAGLIEYNEHGQLHGKVLQFDVHGHIIFSLTYQNSVEQNLLKMYTENAEKTEKNSSQFQRAVSFMTNSHIAALQNKIDRFDTLMFRPVTPSAP